MTFLTETYVDGYPVPGYANIFGCGIEENVDEAKMCAELQGRSFDMVTDKTCRVDLCGDDGCNLVKDENESEETESDVESYVSSETRAGTSIFIVGIFLFLI